MTGRAEGAAPIPGERAFLWAPSRITSGMTMTQRR